MTIEDLSSVEQMRYHRLRAVFLSEAALLQMRIGIRTVSCLPLMHAVESGVPENITRQLAYMAAVQEPGVVEEMGERASLVLARELDDEETDVYCSVLGDPHMVRFAEIAGRVACHVNASNLEYDTEIQELLKKTYREDAVAAARVELKANGFSATDPWETDCHD